MKRLRIVSGFLLPMVFLGLIVPGSAPCSAPGPEGKVAAESINAFAIDLYGQIRKPDENLVFSPYSVSMALAMAYAGARGNTESQIAKAMHLNVPQPQVNEAFAAVNGQVLAAGDGKNIEIKVANALWAEKSYPLLKEYLESVKAYSDQQGWFSCFLDRGLLRQVDFKHNADASRKTINKWVEDQTKNKIKDLLGPGMITSDTRLVLTNAIYFNGKWKKEFIRELTKDDNFTLLNGTITMVPMMHQTDAFGYMEEADLQVLELPYKGGSEVPHVAGDLSMIVLLPSKKTRLEDFEQSMTFDKLDQWTRSLKWRKIEVFLPRFKMTSEFRLRTPLTRLGMTDAFSSSDADFSGMTGNKDLFISEGIHQAFVETNEQGTEAAAATGLTMMRGMASRPVPVPVFRADHPFVFLIRHRPSNCILFLGRVTKP
jgi:serpin B